MKTRSLANGLMVASTFAASPPADSLARALAYHPAILGLGENKGLAAETRL